jgi:hypothetical protein
MSSSLRVLRSRRSAVSALLGALYLSACHSWQVGTPTPAQFVEREHPARVRVTRTDGSTIMLHSPAVRGDSLVGRSAGTPASGDSVRTSAVPLSDVTNVAVQESAAGKTVLLTAGIVVGVVGAGMLAVWLIYCEQDEC